MAGVFLGDHIKGSLNGDRPDHIEAGIRFHRSVDAFVDRHVSQQKSVGRLPKQFRRYGGIVCDVVYDYYLANHWGKFSAQEFEPFCQFSYAQILKEPEFLSKEAAHVIRRMAEHNSLEGYRSKQYIERSLSFISERLSRSNPLKDAYKEFERLETVIESDFLEFLPEVDEFAQAWLLQEASSHLA